MKVHELIERLTLLDQENQVKEIEQLEIEQLMRGDE
jgi:hypothetical protein